MKKSFQILKSKPKVNIKVTRDSVCAADDCLAPHEKMILTPSFTDPEELAFQVASKYGLPTISGGEATWICIFNGLKIAVLAQQWTSAKALVSQISYEDKNEIFFEYLAQESPEKYIKGY